MPVYSISRTSQYTTVTALETKTNQDGFSWNGFDAKNNRLPEGVYVVLIEAFNLTGKTQRLKKVIGIRF